jgi:hypothetical protein
MYRLLENIPIPCLHGPFSGRDIKASSKQWWEFLAPYLNPANLLNLQPEIVDWLLNAYPTDLPRTIYSVDEIERWALEDIKPKRLLDTLHATNPWLIPGYIQHHLYFTDNAGVIDKKPEIFQYKETHEILLKVDYGRWTTVQLITYAYTQPSASRLGYNYWWLF